MSQAVYLHPLTLVSGPQAVEGDAVRLGGSMAYAREFALVVRQDGAVVQRITGTRDAIEGAMARLSGDPADEAAAQWTNLSKVHAPLQLGERTIRFDQPQVMGILNVTPDSFSDGGQHDVLEAGRAHAAAMLEAGAAIIDIGGESTRPGASATFEDEEIRRIVPAVEYCASMGAAISLDTRRAGVLAAGLDAGGHMANDVSALRYDPRSIELVAARGCTVVLMHAPGAGEDLHKGGDYADVVSEVFDFLKSARARAIAAGIAEDRIILDPGIGFGKSLGENLALMNALPLFHALGSPLMLGASRKRMIGALSNEEAADQRLAGSITLAVKAMEAGVHLLRVHDVAETVQARNVWRGLRDAGLTDFSQLPPL
ncbi:dihydropteroate synthase [Porphyrobacter sp. HT-58-2]|uniref:dihydropteroate synthase n=1 Tax=Porphyrobacter sp. HT-58-2 TaxID=2023229 RepID=UPI000CDC449A|nr:dihydropteroate synthase [Porphyrobacter sp. HT-58-2]AUX69359.1 dihydropteroate synthase [Porphyrobacter sp. HT-58-2]